MSKNVVLCGFMGSGKTSIGKRLAKQLKMQFCDVDIYIEKKMKMKVVDIFAKFGEERFREIESEAVMELSEKENHVIASGGGTVLFENNVKQFHRSGDKIYFLDVPLSAIQERLKNDKKRPLLQVPNRREVIDTLYRKRRHQYRYASDYIIFAGAPSVVVAKRLAMSISEKNVPMQMSINTIANRTNSVTTSTKRKHFNSRINGTSLNHHKKQSTNSNKSKNKNRSNAIKQKQSPEGKSNHDYHIETKPKTGNRE